MQHTHIHFVQSNFPLRDFILLETMFDDLLRITHSQEDIINALWIKRVCAVNGKCMTKRDPITRNIYIYIHMNIYSKKRHAHTHINASKEIEQERERARATEWMNKIHHHTRIYLLYPTCLNRIIFCLVFMLIFRSLLLLLLIFFPLFSVCIWIVAGPIRLDLLYSTSNSMRNQNCYSKSTIM